MAILVNYQTTWSQPVIPGQTNILPTSTYPMWYNVIPPFVFLDPNLYPTYQLEQNDLIIRSLGIIQVMYLVMCTQYLNNLYHQHIYHTLLDINFLQWFNQ
jgi:hypothetical protein